MITTCGPRFLTDGDYAVKVTAAGGVPTRLSTPDEITIWRLANRDLLVDTEAGIVYRADGVTRAETPKPNGKGRVYLGRVAGHIRWAEAHRIVWIARHGPIPGMYQVAHINNHGWDNRVANLVLVTSSEIRMKTSGSLTLHAPGDPDDRPDVHPYATARDELMPVTNRRWRDT